MGKVTIKKTLAILLVVLFVATVTAASVSAAPVASATGTITGKIVRFSSTGSTGDSLTFDWDFGDGTTSTAANPTHVYTSNTIHTIRLTVTDNVGDTDTITITK
jgi:PKD repeat protein